MKQLSKNQTLLLVAVALVQATALLLIATADPAWTQLEQIAFIGGLGVLPAATALYTAFAYRSTRRLQLGVLAIAWLALSVKIPAQSSYWVLLIPVLLIIKRVFSLRALMVSGGLMISPLLLLMLSQEQTTGDDMVMLLALALSAIYLWSDHLERKQVPKPRHVSDEQFRSLINSMADGVIAIDKERKITLYNGASLNILNVNVSLEGKSLDRYLPLVDSEGESVNFDRLIAQMRGYYVNRDYKLVFPDGDNVNLYIGITPVHGEYGAKSPDGYVVLLRDITKEKTLEEERDDFISVVSHELRTPTAVTEGSVSNALLLLSKNSDPAEIKTALEQAHEQSVFLGDLINDLATLSRAERGVLVVEPESINPEEFVKSLVKEYEDQAKAKRIRLVAHAEPKLRTLTTSRLYLQEIMQNFITNAIKYTPSGTVTITAAPHPNGVLFGVKDTGIGISKSDLKKIFEKFFRAEETKTREFSGTGLGLYVTKKLTRLIGAEIEVESALGQGSQFRILVPNYVPEPKRASSP